MVEGTATNCTLSQEVAGKREIKLDSFRNNDFRRGRSATVEVLWLVFQALILKSFIPGSIQRRAVLRLFGARIGKGVVIKPGVKVKFPWRLDVGDHSWIGEDVWIDNLAEVRIGANCCLSQGAYLCTGSHDWSSRTFNLLTRGITIGDGCWLAARAVVGPGAKICEGAVLALGSTATGTLEPWTIYRGNPAIVANVRSINAKPTS